MLESKNDFSKIKKNLKDKSHLIQHFNQLEEMILNYEQLKNSQEQALNISDTEHQKKSISFEKTFWEMRDIFINLIKSFGIKKNEIKKKLDLSETKKKNLTKKIIEKKNQFSKILETKAENEAKEKKLNNILAKLPEMSTKRIYSDEEIIVLKEILKELEEQNQADIEEEIELSKNKFKLKNSSKNLLKSKL